MAVDSSQLCGDVFDIELASEATGSRVWIGRIGHSVKNAASPSQQQDDGKGKDNEGSVPHW